jgi:hypothetical protein
MGVLGFLRRKHRSADSATTEKTLAAVLLKEGVFETRQEFFAAIARAVPNGEPLPEPVARLLITRLRGFCDGYGEKNSADLKDVVLLWAELARRTRDPLVRACHAEALLLSGKTRRAVREFFSAFGERPELLFEFGNDLPRAAAGLGDDTLFEYRLLHLRALLDSEAEEVRELYSELLDEYAEQPACLRRLQVIGNEIDQAVLAGKLPRALVRRGASRRDREPERLL